MATYSFCTLLLFTGASMWAPARAFFEERYLKPYNQLAGVQSGNSQYLGLVMADLFLAKTTFQGCSVRDRIEGKNLTDSLELMLFYGENNVSVPVTQSVDLMNMPEYDKSKEFIVYSFGYGSDADNMYTKMITDAYVYNGKYNTLVLDWSEAAACPFYEVTVDVMDLVAEKAAVALSKMLNAGARLAHLSGHSLGAQLSGTIARNLKRLGHSVKHIVALDPASPLYDRNWLQCSKGLSPRDADCVEAIYTDIGGLGSGDRRGHKDIYPNGGTRPQPNCPSDGYTETGELVGACSHLLALYVWETALRNVSTYSTRCDSWEKFQEGSCANNAVIPVGLCNSKVPKGKYYMKFENVL